MTKIIIYIIVFISSFHSNCFCYKNKFVNNELEINIYNGLVDLEAKNISISYILNQLSLKTNINIYIKKATYDVNVSCSYKRVPIDRVIMRIIKLHASYSFLYKIDTLIAAYIIFNNGNSIDKIKNSAKINSNTEKNYNKISKTKTIENVYSKKNNDDKKKSNEIKDYYYSEVNFKVKLKKVEISIDNVF
ncbi:hypothetical protein MHK_010241, partial [Candidatus Magnetomorum sp. HK-1]